MDHHYNNSYIHPNSQVVSINKGRNGSYHSLCKYPNINALSIFFSIPLFPADQKYFEAWAVEVPEIVEVPVTCARQSPGLNPPEFCI